MKTIELLLEEEQNYFMREAFNTLRTNILFSGKDIKVIVVTSCLAHEGKTTVTLKLVLEGLSLRPLGHCTQTTHCRLSCRDLLASLLIILQGNLSHIFWESRRVEAGDEKP